MVINDAQKKICKSITPVQFTKQFDPQKVKQIHILYLSHKKTTQTQFNIHLQMLIPPPNNYPK